MVMDEAWMWKCTKKRYNNISTSSRKISPIFLNSLLINHSIWPIQKLAMSRILKDSNSNKLGMATCNKYKLLNC